MNFGKLLVNIFSLLFAAVLLSSVTVSAVTEESQEQILKYGEFEYEISHGDYITITKCIPNNTDKDIMIPAEIDGLPVQSLDSSAFFKCTEIQSVTIPKGVRTFNAFNFQYCEKLTAIHVDKDNEYYMSENGIVFNKEKTHICVFPRGRTDTSYTIPDGVKIIGNLAFTHCGYLKTINIPNTMETIQYSAFDNCTALTQIIIPDSVTEIDSSAFFKCQSLTNAKLPKNIDKISHTLFSGCQNLESIEIPENVTVIDNMAFYGCTALSDVKIPDKVEIIGEYAFYECQSIFKINIPSGVTSVSSDSFIFCKSLYKINVDENNKNYTSIDGVLFTKDKKTLMTYPCGKIDNEYTVPDGVENIEGSAFGSSVFLVNVRLPDSIKTIGDFAFGKCQSLESINLPDGLTKIETLTFSDCCSLSSIVISKSVTEIGGGAFGSCTGLTEAVIENDKIELADTAFNHCTQNLVLYGGKNSAAEAYAKENNFQFRTLEEYRKMTVGSETDTIKKSPENNTENDTSLTIVTVIITGAALSVVITVIILYERKRKSNHQ